MAINKYSATLTGNPFLLLETREVAKRMIQGLSKDEIHSEIIKFNLFQYKNTKSITKRFNAIYKRLDGLTEILLKKLADGSVQEAKVTNLLLIAKSDRLFREFLMEVVSEKMKEPTPILSDREIAHFFAQKGETVQAISEWTEKTIKKLSQVYVQILYQAGMIGDRKNATLQGFIVNHGFKKELASSFSKDLIHSITG